MNYTTKELEKLKNSPLPYPEIYSGRGIVISAGGPYIASAYLAIKSLRHAGCTLPIQVWHLGAAEFPEVLKPIFTQHGVETVDAHEIQRIHRIKNLGGWQNKPFSIMHCPYKEVFSFDADNLALLNPDFLFDHPEYKKAGAIFWPDLFSKNTEYWKIKPFAWECLGLPPRDHAEIESGQLLVNKEHCWIPLQVALHMNENSDFYYNLCTYGDKDTYTLAWDYCGHTPFVINKRPELMEHMVRIQYGPSNEELFQHARKWVIPAEVNPKYSSYRLQDLCFDWLKEFEVALKSLSS